ncbi:MAG: BBP7 family outer membrane beta-barrel protein, partial [Planctomycetota bacterium]
SDDDFAGTDRIYGGINYAGLEYDRDGAGGGTYAYRPLNDYYDYQAPIDSTSTNDLRVLAVRVRQTFQVQNIELNFWRFGSPATPGLGGGAGCGSGVGGGVGSGVLRNAIAGASGCGPACGSAGCGCEPCGCAPASPPRRFFINGLAGVRYMKLDETFRNSVFFAAAADPTYPGDMPTTGAGADQVIFHDIEVDNDLVGFQLGCSMNCLVGCRWTLFADTNFGIYGNSIDAYQRVYSPGGGGTVRFVQTGNDAVVRSSKEDVSFLGEARLGVGYQITPRCRLTSAYRVIAVSGVALAPSQITTPINEAAFGHIDSNDSIVIHGFQGGVEFKY